MTARLALRLLAGLCIGLLAVATVRGQGGETSPVRITVLLSQDALPYREFAAGFESGLREQQVPAAVTVRVLDGNADAARRTVREGRDGTDIFVPLGTAAVRAVSDERPGVPVIGSMVLRETDLASTENATGVVLEFEPEVEFQWLRRILPDVRRVGVLYNTAENQQRVGQAARAAGGAMLELHGVPVATPRDLPDALASVARSADVLWGVADRVVMTPETAKPILLFSLRHRIPFVGLSTPWVKAGALYALDRDYPDLGRQAAELAARVVRGQPAHSIRPVRPRKAALTVNRRTAAELKLQLPPDVLKQARVIAD